LLAPDTLQERVPPAVNSGGEARMATGKNSRLATDPSAVAPLRDVRLFRSPSFGLANLIKGTRSPCLSIFAQELVAQSKSRKSVRLSGPCGFGDRASRGLGHTPLEPWPGPARTYPYEA